MEVELTIALEVEQEEGQTDEDVFELLLEYLKGSFYDNDMIKKVIDMEIESID